MRAAALHLSAAISADVKARRILTSGRRKFPSGNFRSARDLEGAKRVSRGQAYRQTSTVPRLPGDRTARLRHRNPRGPSPFARNRGMSPFPIRSGLGVCLLFLLSEQLAVRLHLLGIDRPDLVD